MGALKGEFGNLPAAHTTIAVCICLCVWLSLCLCVGESVFVCASGCVFLTVCVFVLCVCVLCFFVCVCMCECIVFFKARSAFSKQLCPLSSVRVSVCLSVTLFCMGNPYLCF